jgi:hypothetical protein
MSDNMLAFFEELPEELASQVYMRLTATKLRELGINDNEYIWNLQRDPEPSIWNLQRDPESSIWNLQRDPESSIWTILRKYYPVTLSLYAKLRSKNTQLPFRAITLLFQIEQQYSSDQDQAIKFGELKSMQDYLKNSRVERVYIESDSLSTDISLDRHTILL